MGTIQHVLKWVLVLCTWLSGLQPHSGLDLPPHHQSHALWVQAFLPTSRCSGFSAHPQLYTLRIGPITAAASILDWTKPPWMFQVMPLSLSPPVCPSTPALCMPYGTLSPISVFACRISHTGAVIWSMGLWNLAVEWWQC